MALFPVSADGIDLVCKYSGELDEIQKADQKKIESFIAKSGKNYIYELSTF